MTWIRTNYFRQAVLFAAGFEGILILVGWLMYGGPQSMESLPEPSPAIVLGIPSLAQLLAGPHQVSVLDLDSADNMYNIIAGTVGTLLYLLTTGFYISLLARTVHKRPTPAWREAFRAWVPLLLWMITQMVFALLISLVFTSLFDLFMHKFINITTFLALAIPGVISAIFLLWFRYHFLYMEYASALLRLPQPKIYNTAIAVRKANPKPARIFFFSNLLLNIVLSLLINYFFSWPTLIAALLLNAWLQTWMQQRLLTHFIHASDAMEQSAGTTSTDSQIPLY